MTSSWRITAPSGNQFVTIFADNAAHFRKIGWRVESMALIPFIKAPAGPQAVRVMSTHRRAAIALGALAVFVFVLFASGMPA